MKLLKKPELTSLKAQERKIEIDEGAKLAKKIDLLRQMSSEEESRLAKFRTESLRVIKEELEKLTATRSSIINEIAILTKKRDSLQDAINEIKNN